MGLKFYHQAHNEYPTTNEIIKRVKKVSNSREAVGYLNTLLRGIKNNPNSTKRDRILSLFCGTEFIILNIDICYGSPVFEKTINSYLFTIGSQPLLNNYLENFKKICVKGYLENLKYQAKKKLITFYMNNVYGLCFDIVEHIMSFY